jgi:hypothetical protein
MQRFVHMLQRTAPLWILWIACAGTAQAQSPKTTVVNDTNEPVTVTVVNPPFPPMKLNTIPAGESSTIGAPAGATLEILDAGTKQLVTEISVTQTRKVALTAVSTTSSQASEATSPDDDGTSSDSADSEGTLHVILACDVDDPELGEGFEINEGVVRQQFFDTVATRNLRYYSPWNSGAFDSRPKLTAENLLEEIDNIQLEPNDTLMVYLACHGFWDKDDGQQWFRFENDGDKALLRKTLINRIKSRKTRLGLLITDACTNYEKLPSDRTQVSPPLPPVEETAPLYQSLFFDQQGFLDLSSSSPGQFTLYYNNYKDLKVGNKPKINKSQASREIPGGGFLDKYYLQLNGDTMQGGLFTESMRSLLLAKSDEKMDWKQFTELLRDEVESQFDQEVPDGKLKTGAGTIFQDAQTVVMGEFPRALGETDMSTDPEPSSGPATTKFGVSVVANSDGGVTIESVRDGSTAARHGASVGEVIEKINNRPVNTPVELEAALAKAAATFRVTIGGESFVVRQ